MKLQKNNKYANRFVTGLVSIALNASILIGCANTNSATDSMEPAIPIVQVIETAPTKRDENYYANYYKINDSEVNERYSNFNVKYPNALWSMDFITTVLVRDSNNDYKVIQTISFINEETNKIEVFDLATEERLFDFPYSELVLNENGKYANANLGMADNKIDYFNDKDIVAFGCISYQFNFLNDIINELKEKDGKNYQVYTLDIFYDAYKTNYMDFDTTFKRTEELLKEYVKYVPIENQVTSEELGLTITYPPERKYADSWKIDEEEISKRVEKLAIADPDEKFTMGSVDTLVIKDADSNYKLLSIFMTFSENEEERDVYDLYTKKYLFTIKIGDGLIYDFETTVYDNFDSSIIVDSIDYFKDKTICYLAGCVEVNKFLSRNIDELSRKDGIEYIAPDSPIYYNLFPTGEYYLERQLYTVEQYARNYVTLPEGMYVTAKELGFEKDKVKSLN